ncbi:acid-sensing ion channel 2-like [Ptychodera flava]|uniref:acid-sensing ion channel 2-like n=1 Tax=Ptychodera flava TaxID=63121 RepID=UPI00396A5266
MESAQKNDGVARDEMTRKYKVLLGDVMTNSTVHGLPNIRRAKSVPKRIFWSVSFLTAVGLFIGFSSVLVSKYLEYDVDVGVQVNVERDLTFPAVTICNLNPLRKLLLDEGETKHLQRLIEQALSFSNDNVYNTTESANNDTGINSTDQGQGHYNHWDHIDENFYRSPSSLWLLNNQIQEYLADFEGLRRREIGHQIDDMLITCQWSNEQCSPRNFTHFLNSMYGNCYTFNGGNNTSFLSTNFAGSTYGLTLELFVEQDEYLDGLIHSAGIRVTIHSQDDTPFPEDSGFNVEPGKLTSVGITMGKTERLPDPFTDCVPANTSKYQTAFRSSYSVQACMKSCLLTYIADTCNCTDPRYPRPDGYDDFRHCQYQIFEHRMCKSTADLMYQADRLTCDCPPKCVTDTHAREVSSTLWPSMNSVDYVYDVMKGRSSKLRMLLEEQERTGLDLFGKNVLKLEVYLRDLARQEITQSQSYTEIDLVSDIGGNLGLWIGLSVLTIMEFLELIFDMFATLRFVRHSRGNHPPHVEREVTYRHDDRLLYPNGHHDLIYTDGDIFYTQSDYDRHGERTNGGVYYMQRNIYLPK